MARLRCEAHRVRYASAASFSPSKPGFPFCWNVLFWPSRKERGSPMEVSLTILDHSGAERGVVLDRLPAILGRDETADVPLKDPWTSHRHCQIDQLGDVLVVRNLGSKNGIFMQGRRVDESHLVPGDQFTIGQTVVTVHYWRGSQTTLSAGEATRIVARPVSPKPETEELLFGVANREKG
jgi:pSer/pThr/pTyr-binding forkhead associated (FHA) protein